MKPLCILIVTAACLALAGPATAGVTPEGTGEPAYTNSSQNTQWFRWPATSGADDYRIKVSYYRDNVLVKEETTSVPVGGGTGWANWSGVAQLEEGRQYGICVQGSYSFPNDPLYFPDGPNSCSMGSMLGKRTYTTIDRTKPTASIVAAGGAEFTKNGSIPVSIGFSDATAGPFPANFICVKAGAEPCQTGFGQSSACSVPGGPGKSTTFNCSVDASQLSDGPVTVCVRAADGAVPDKPSSADQSASPTEANLSDTQCDTVTLDRQAPVLGMDAPGALNLGVAALFSSNATDSGSGIDTGSARWDFGDGTAPVAAAQTSRAFNNAGTHVVTFRAKDKAGNESVVEKTVTVTAPAGEGSTPDSTPGTEGTPAPTVDKSLANVRIGSLTLLVPKRIRIGKVKQLRVGTSTDEAGTLTLRLMRGKKLVSQLRKVIAAGSSTQRLRLPKRLKAGGYTVKIAFKPAGASWSAAGTAKVALRK